MPSDRTDELDEQDVSALKEMAAWWRESRMGRRAVLGLSTGAAAGLATGGGFMAGRASADASTGDSDGDVGEPGDRVDVFADGVDVADLTATTSVSGDGLDLSTDPENPTEILRYVGTNVALGFAAVETTIAGDNNAAPIFNIDRSEAHPYGSGKYIVHGKQRSDDSELFTDIITVAYGFSATINEVDSNTNGTISRSYSQSGTGTGGYTSIDLAIDKAGETFDVGIWFTGGAVPI